MFRISLSAVFVGCLLAVPVCLADHHKEAEGEWITLFDGKSLDAWRGYNTEKVPEGWVVEDGGLRHVSGGVDLLTKKQFADFELRFEWKIAAHGNSGVIYRCDESEGASYMTGPEYQLLDNDGWGFASDNVHSSGALYALYGASKKADRPAGEWNTSRILISKGHVEHWLNDKLVVSAELGSDDWKQRVADSKFDAWKKFGTLKKGHIALQAHNGKNGEVEPVCFRNVKIRPLNNASR